MVYISLTTDWHKQDYYSGMMKGRLLSLIPDAHIVEVSNRIGTFHALEGAFVLRQVITEFAAGSIHLFTVNQGNLPDVYPLLIKTKLGAIVAWQNAVQGLLIDEKPEYCLRVTPVVFQKMKAQLEISNTKVYPSFPELGLFPVIAKAFFEKLDLSDLGPDESDLITNSPWLPVIQEQSITGHIIYIDSYGNAITNISRELFDKIRQDRKYEILLVSNRYRITHINTAYLETEPGEILALFNSLSLLELAQVHGNVSELLGMETGSTIKIKFI